jgi:hypothetical protein
MAFQLQKNDVILLLGAGASVEAKIPATIAMIESIEVLLSNDWSDYKGLYEFIKEQNAILNKPFNVEDLVNILSELLELLEKKHPLTGFHLSWIDFLEKVGFTKKLVVMFKEKIVEKLRDWVEVENVTSAAHYRPIAIFQKQYIHPLRIFTLNYDKCIELACKSFLYEDETRNCLIERGFGNEDISDEIWNWKKFKRDREEENSTNEKIPDIFLYKMHGSIDWTRDENQNLIHKAHSRIKNFEIIFGTRQKVKYYDPFLFFIYEFREYSLSSKMIIVCGYGFGDDHINGILRQSLESNNEKIIVVNKYSGTEQEGIEFVKKNLKLKDDKQIRVVIGKASDFLENKLTIDSLNDYLPLDDLPF